VPFLVPDQPYLPQPEKHRAVLWLLAHLLRCFELPNAVAAVRAAHTQTQTKVIKTHTRTSRRKKELCSQREITQTHAHTWTHTYIHTYAYTHTVLDHHYDKIDFSLGSLFKQMYLCCKQLFPQISRRTSKLRNWVWNARASGCSQTLYWSYMYIYMHIKTHMYLHFDAYIFVYIHK